MWTLTVHTCTTLVIHTLPNCSLFFHLQVNGGSYMQEMRMDCVNYGRKNRKFKVSVTSKQKGLNLLKAYWKAPSQLQFPTPVTTSLGFNNTLSRLDGSAQNQAASPHITLSSRYLPVLQKTQSLMKCTLTQKTKICKIKVGNMISGHSHISQFIHLNCMSMHTVIGNPCIHCQVHVEYYIKLQCSFLHFESQTKWIQYPQTQANITMI